MLNTLIDSLCNTCINNTEAYPFLQCSVEPMDPRTQYIRPGKLFITQEEYDHLLGLRKQDCIKYHSFLGNNNAQYVD
jgi:hypothetical protein